MNIISYGKQSIDRSDIKAVCSVLRSDRLTQGPFVEDFERALCAYTGARYGVAVASGTAALHCAVLALRLKKGCSGITSPITFLASANALLYGGLVPLFADIDPQTITLSAQALAGAIRKDTRVVIPVHFAGRPADMEKIASLARRKKYHIIEDAAHAIGSRYKDGGRVGNCAFSDMTIFSFHPVKTITTGEGGAITTNDKNLYELLKRLRSHGIMRDPRAMKRPAGPWYYEMRELGFNYRLTDIQAALGSSQLKKIDRFVGRRRRIAALYHKAFRSLSWLRPVSLDDEGVAHHLYVVRIDFKRLGMTRCDLMEKLSRRGVGTQVHYIPVYRQPFYKRTFKFSCLDFPEAEKYYKECLSLPLYPAMTDKDVDRVIAAFLQFS